MGTRGSETWDLILALFPFAVILDAEGRVQRIGPRMAAMADLRVGQLMSDGLTQVSPRRPFAVQEARRRSSMLITLATAGDLRFRGQCVPWESDGVLFVGGPRVMSMDDVHHHGLRLSDFPPHDPRLDLLVLVATKETALDDARRLTSELREAKADIESRAEELSSELVRREAATSLGRLIAGVAHEVNTPLGVSLTALSVLMESVQALEAMVSSNAIRRSTLNTNLESIHAASKLVHLNLERAASLIRDFKQIAVDQSLQDTRAIDVSDYINQVVGSLAPLMNGTEVQVVIDAPTPAPCVTSPGALSQVVTILIENAMLHAFPSGKGTIRITVRTDDAQIRIVVSDDGAGMEAEVLRNATSPFFTTRRVEGGSGLGLFILQRLANEGLNGRMELESAPDVGTTATLWLPRDVHADAHSALVE